jgi:hypothetical protein
MDITFNDDDGTVTILMKEYLKEAIADSGMDASKVAPTPAKKDLFTVDDGSEQLDKQQGDIFHSIVAKLLFVSKRARTDAQLAIAGLVQHGAGLEKVNSDSSNILTVLWTCLSFSELTVSPNRSRGLTQPMLCTTKC